MYSAITLLDRALHISNIIQRHFGRKGSKFAGEFAPPSHKTLKEFCMVRGTNYPSQTSVYKIARICITICNYLFHFNLSPSNVVSNVLKNAVFSVVSMDFRKQILAKRQKEIRQIKNRRKIIATRRPSLGVNGKSGFEKTEV